MDDEALLSELGIDVAESDITNLKHVRTRAEIKAAEEIANRTPCLDFEKFSPLFKEVQAGLDTGQRIARPIRKDAGFLKSDIKEGEFFILGGQIAYVAEVGEPIKAPNGQADARLRVVYSNGTESDLLLRSLQRALYKDETSCLVSELVAGPLFSDVVEDGDDFSGTIYVLRSNSEDPRIKGNRDVIHKIGVTSGDVKKRLANAKLDPTFLMADVEVVAEYKLHNISRVKLEWLIHKFFEPAKLDIEITDRFGNPVVPREWFLAPLFVIDEAIEKIKDGSIVNYRYEPSSGKILDSNLGK